MYDAVVICKQLGTRLTIATEQVYSPNTNVGTQAHRHIEVKAYSIGPARRIVFILKQHVVEEPEFTDVIQNVTVPAGRSVRLACSVKNLGSYKIYRRLLSFKPCLSPTQTRNHILSH
ncbi:hypothetical protein HW555_002520 [Spodoptera exigua]|uniref:Uncharacterized protein n=1 Tax=Spodoptera exigua TaxID=7107 RepID=A0A835GN33_SPOEX|nr:hypothetical protein HW555_002520 [Spodoptera exigua]